MVAFRSFAKVHKKNGGRMERFNKLTNQMYCVWQNSLTIYVKPKFKYMLTFKKSTFQGFKKMMERSGLLENSSWWSEKFWRPTRIFATSSVLRCLIYWIHTVFARVICALFSSFDHWKIGVRKICGFFLWRSWSGFYSSINENTVLLLIFYCNFVT